MRPAPVYRDKSCERQRMFGELDLSEGIIVSRDAEEEEMGEVCGGEWSRVFEVTGDRVALSSGWVRHTVDTSLEGSVLGFKLTVSGSSRKDLGRWLGQQVVRDDVLCANAADLAVAIKLRICISTGRLILKQQPESEDESAEANYTADSSANERPEGQCMTELNPTVLYFYENFGTPRFEGVFQTPVGYWSTSPDDSPSAEEIMNQRALYERRGIEYAGYSEKPEATDWVQEIGGMTFLSRVRVYIDKCHFSRDECALLREIRPALKHHICEASVALMHEPDD
ncbi:hypothetical protein L227DRAFT_259292 [Lentinus tigrinus ALCF2SS1-6]|uniref:Uncharacterized protein n=1 Tax=Lentinus tigrinus ALCF2SS1-6 TaxID=1328759 RepID=A0A5C2RZP4_9APHY|nr:hypothetical protein L227DRAFT_259292 [Lentinus tigrinus ALCF2SS1-6]